MGSYSESLKSYLAGSVVQADLAARIGKTQAAVARYAGNQRFPDADTARRIDAATNGAVSFAIWRAEFEYRSGLCHPTKEGKAA